jgi:hypothetical protein
MGTESESSKYIHTLTVHVALRDVRNKDEAPEVVAYVFDNFGQLVGLDEVNAEGVARITLSTIEGVSSLRVVAGPKLETNDLSTGNVIRVGGQEHVLDVRKLPERIEIAVDRARWLTWFLNYCCVKGQVVKPVAGVNLPICEASVEIYEVDPWIILVPKIPTDILKKIKDIVVGPWPPIPWPPIPGPDPGPLGPVIDPVGLNVAREIRVNPVRMFAAQTSSFMPSSTTAASVQANALPRSLVSAAQLSDEAFRNELLKYQFELIPILCWHPWWWRFVTMQKICQTTTNCSGEFACCFIRPWHDPDQPDLWFRVRQNIPGFGDTVIYQRYPVGCHTHWNYQCGTTVTLTVTDPRAFTCSCGPEVGNSGNWVLVDQIGSIICSQIRGMSAALDGTTTSANRGQTDDGRPFAGLIQPTIYFSPALTAAGVKYKFSFKRADEDDTHWQDLTAPISRSYLYTSGADAAWGTFPLGPGVSDGLYLSRPALPPQGTWETRYYRADRSAADWNTFVDLPAGSFGLYQLRLEVFRNDGTPLAMNDASLGFKYLLGKEGTTIQEEAATLSLVSGNALILNIYIDLEACTAHINSPAIGMASASPQCGGLNFSDPSSTVTLSYVANQPRGFYTYDFKVVRGQGNTVFHIPNGGPGIPQSYGVTVSSLIGPCPDGAAFAATLDVNSTATDGYYRVSALDAPFDSFGFMLLNV